MSRPFDAKRYRCLLEGLEVSVVPKHTITDDLRIDAEFFQKRYLVEDSALARRQTILLGDIATVTDGPHGYHVVDEASPIAMLTAKCASEWFASRDDADTIAMWVDEQNSRSRLKQNDVILSTRGTVGLCALVTSECLPANIDQDVARISLAGNQDVPAEYLAAYLNSRYGQDHIVRHASGMVQQGLSLKKVREIPIPRVGEDAERAVGQIVRRALDARRRSRSELNAAENTLTAALGLDGWQPPQALSYTCRASEVFSAARVDAEYFHPAKKAALDLLATLPGRAVGEMFQSVRELWSPAGLRGDSSIRNYDLTRALNPFLDDSVEPTEIAAISSIKKRIKQGDLVVSRLRSYLREIAVAVDDDPLQVVSTEFIVLRSRTGELKSGALLIYLRSLLPQLVFKWSQDGSNHPRFDEKELLNLRVPDVIVEKQDELNECFLALAEMHRHARELLAAAQRAVEIAIEQNEAAALAYLTEAGIKR